jgi:hypothetical protein
MFSVLLILVFLVVAMPLTIIFDGPITQGLLAVATALSIVLVALRIRPGEAGFLSSVLLPGFLFATFPALVMLIQLFPVQGIGLAHPVWDSASTVLGYSLAGTISVDPGATVISLVRYLSAASITFVAAAVAVDRRRAKVVLFSLMVATALIALTALKAKTGVSTFQGTLYGSLARANAETAASLGIIFAIAAGLLTYEQARMQRQELEISPQKIWAVSAICVIAVMVYLTAVLIQGTGDTYYAAICGVVTLAIVVIIRWVGLGAWGVAALVSTTLFIAIAVAALQFNSGGLDVALAFASQDLKSEFTVTQRLLAETNWLGTGAGTFASVVPIYQDIASLENEQIAPTTAAAIMIEMGRPFFWTMLMVAIIMVWSLFRGALRRQRDFYYPAVGASCIVVIALLSFRNSALLATPISTIAAVAIGLAIAQSKSRLV